MTVATRARKQMRALKSVFVISTILLDHYVGCQPLFISYFHFFFTGIPAPAVKFIQQNYQTFFDDVCLVYATEILKIDMDKD